MTITVYPAVVKAVKGGNEVMYNDWTQISHTIECGFSALGIALALGFKLKTQHFKTGSPSTFSSFTGKSYL
jgi:hypothetical protein